MIPVPVPAMSAEPPLHVGGLPIGTFVQAAIRRARQAMAPPAPSVVSPPVPVAVPVPAEPLPLAALHALTRHYALAELAVAMANIASDAAIHREHVEGLALGRTYGDPTLRGLEPSECLLRELARARTRADQAGAIADVLRALVGREAALDLVLMGGAGV